MKLKTYISPLISTIFYLFSSNVSAQCIANAGSDTTLCVSFEPAYLILGGSPTASGGVPPYTYLWSGTYSIGPLTYTASDFLDDITSANPLLTDISPDSLVLYLTVTDNVGSICKDTIKIKFCQYVWTLDYKFVYIDQGDTTQIGPSVGDGCPPYSFVWSPNYNISDPYAENPVVWPDTTTFYTSIVTDAAGCEAGGGTFDVFVISTGISNYENHKTIKIFPNPITDKSVVTVSNYYNSDLSLCFYNIYGRFVHHINITGLETEILRKNFEAGIYFYQLLDNGKPLESGKILIQ